MKKLYTLTYTKEFNENAIDKAEIKKLIERHESRNVPSFKHKKNYYDGRHIIQNKARESSSAPNTKAVCNHAKDISDTASGYFMGESITYDNTSENETDMEPLLMAFDEADVDDTDGDNALDMSVYGVAYEYVYAKEGTTDLTTKTLEPENTFIVYDDTIEQKPLFAVYYHLRKDDITEESVYVATVLTENLKYVLNIETKNTISEVDETSEKHFMGAIPVICYQNNRYCIGDFEQQISLIDAYNTLMSDRINDKEQFIDALLVLYGAQLGDDEKETSKAAKALRREKLIEMPIDAKAEYLVSSLDEAGAEVLRKAIKEDIYTFSHVPNLTDENFIGNSSGVAMEYKLLGLEMITKIKTRWYKKGLRKRMELFCNYLGLKNLQTEAKSIVPVFSRGLPKNLIEIAQMVANLKGTVSQKTLLMQIPFVEDPDDEIDSVNVENEEALKRQQKAFGNEPNYPPAFEDKPKEKKKAGEVDGKD